MKKEEFEFMVNRCYTMYMQQNNNVMFNLLDSHDTERLMNRFHSLDTFYQQLAVLFTMPGSPCIFYGTEIVMGTVKREICISFRLPSVPARMTSGRNG